MLKYRVASLIVSMNLSFVSMYATSFLEINQYDLCHTYITLHAFSLEYCILFCGSFHNIFDITIPFVIRQIRIDTCSWYQFTYIVNIAKKSKYILYYCIPLSLNYIFSSSAFSFNCNHTFFPHSFQ